MRVLTFSRFYPAYHPKKGQETFFPEKIYRSLGVLKYSSYTPSANVNGFEPKFHTIRGGNRWKVGDWFSPRIWSGKPYASKQIEFAPPIQVKKVWPITIQPHNEHGFVIHINDRYVADWEGTANITQSELAKNDGLEKADLLHWFRVPKPFTGQIICWNENINY